MGNFGTLLQDIGIMTWKNCLKSCNGIFWWFAGKYGIRVFLSKLVRRKYCCINDCCELLELCLKIWDSCIFEEISDEEKLFHK